MHCMHSQQHKLVKCLRQNLRSRANIISAQLAKAPVAIRQFVKARGSLGFDDQLSAAGATASHPLDLALQADRSWWVCRPSMNWASWVQSASRL